MRPVQALIFVAACAVFSVSAQEACIGSNGQICSGNGVCFNSTQGMICACTPGYYGRTCQNQHNATNSCTGPNGQLCSGQGTCLPAPNGDFICECAAPWAGQYCTFNATVDCMASNGLMCSGNGQCIADGNNDDAACYCNMGWYGSLCNQVLPTPVPTQSMTVTLPVTETSSDNVDGCIGPDGAVCSGYGQCTNNTCICSVGYSLPYCQPQNETAACGGANGLVCSGHGQCNTGPMGGYTGCTCFYGYVGMTCETPATPSPMFPPQPPQQSMTVTLPITETTSANADGCIGPDGAVCSGAGTCISNACGCAEGYTGQYCQTKQVAPCGGANGNPCNGHGQCAQTSSGDYSCTCFPGFVGTLCQTPAAAPPTMSNATTSTTSSSAGAAATSNESNGWASRALIAAPVFAAATALLAVVLAVVVLRMRRQRAQNEESQSKLVTFVGMPLNDDDLCSHIALPMASC